MRIFATFGGFENGQDETKLIWKNVNSLNSNPKGVYLSKFDSRFKKYRLRFGDRYIIDFEKVSYRELVNVTKVKKTYKNPKCDLIRKIDDNFLFIRGKYYGKVDSDLDLKSLISYVEWVSERSNNEATIKNLVSLTDKIRRTR